MNSKERVKRAIHFQKPDRIPYHLPSPYESDITWIFPKTKYLQEETRNGKRYRQSEYGSWWNFVSEQNMGEIVDPVIKDWSDYDKYTFPDINAQDRYEHVKQIIDCNKDKYIMGVLNISLFPGYWEIRGMLNFFEDLMFNSVKMEKMLDDIVDLQLESLDIWSRYDIDGIVVGFDDWGLQDRLMIDPKAWREFFMPRYKTVWDAIHQKGFDVILHSCGDITSIMDDMIDIGLNVINMDQQVNMGVDRLAKEFGGRICFWNPTDIQKIMLLDDTKEIIKYTKNMIEKLGSFDGGFIGKYYPQPEAAGHSDANSKASFDTFVEEAYIY